MLEAHFFQLNCRVFDLESIADDVAEFFQDLVPVLVAAEHCVAAQSMEPGSECPNVQIMDGCDTPDSAECGPDGFQIDMSGSTLQQNIHRLFDELPRTVENQQTHDDTRQRVRDIPLLEDHQDSRHDRAD